MGQVQRVLRAVEAAKGRSAPAAGGAETPPLSIPAVKSSTAFRDSRSPTPGSDVDPASSHQHHLQALDALAELQRDPFNAALLRGLVQRPPHWGGFVLRPRLFEFWEDGQYRLHSRVLYARGERSSSDRTDSADTDGATADWQWSNRFLAP